MPPEKPVEALSGQISGDSIKPSWCSMDRQSHHTLLPVRRPHTRHTHRTTRLAGPDPGRRRPVPAECSRLTQARRAGASNRANARMALHSTHTADLARPRRRMRADLVAKSWWQSGFKPACATRESRRASGLRHHFISRSRIQLGRQTVEAKPDMSTSGRGFRVADFWR